MKKLSVSQVSKAIEKQITSFKTTVETKTVGEIIDIQDGVASVGGLSSCMYGEVLEFPKNTSGIALSLEKDSVGAVILGDYQHLKEGAQVKSTGRLLTVPVGPELLGRVVDPLGRPLDGKPKIRSKTNYPIERIAPGVISRQPVDTPLQTGIKAIDSIIPIGRGQRELIIGDRSTGKSAIALTTIINQRKQNIACIYVAVGQKSSFIARLVATLEKFSALDHSIIIAASASTPASLQFLAPYTGCAMGEYFADLGKDALVIYDDLSKHAWAYRELSLLLKRPSGREAYPGDIFYLHSRLLERAVRLNSKHGGGSLTALPIIETQAGDLSAYIPTNVISITDGQIYLEPDLFNAGVRPAINVGLSVSRVGGAAQVKAMKQVAGQLRLDFAQYRELAAFSQFSSDLDEATQQQLDRGARITEILKQSWDEPTPLPDQVIIIWAVTKGHLDEVELDKIKDWESQFCKFIVSKYPSIITEIKKKLEISESLEKKLVKAATRFNQLNPKLLKPIDEEKGEEK